MADDLWIVIPNWERFQHYKDRDPPWIKLHRSLASDPDWQRLSGHDRAVLVGLWLEYASSNRRVRLDTRSISSRLTLRVTSATLKRLGHAGLIEVVASAVLATDRDRDRSSTYVLEEADGSADESAVENHVVDSLVAEIRDANDTTLSILRSLQSQLPESAFARALESLRTRRNRKPTLKSEARYVVGTLKTMQRERTSR